MKKIYYLWMLLCILPLCAFAQQRSISGKVTDAKDGTPLPGVSVYTVDAAGKRTGGSTNARGEYLLNVPAAARELQFVYLGMTTVTEQISGRSTIDVKMSATDEMLSANTYTVQPVRGNFIDLAPQDVQISGNTTLDFTAVPYIRIREANIVKNGTKVAATFRLQQTATNNVKRIGLYAHQDSRAGEPMRFVAAEADENAVTDTNHTYTLSIDLPSNSSQLKPGKAYYFRVGAVIDKGDAKFNYAPVVKLDI